MSVSVSDVTREVSGICFYFIFFKFLGGRENGERGL